MNDIVSYNHYRFVYMDFKRSFHHTDNTKGSPYHYLAYLKEGNCKIVSEKETVEIKTGDVFLSRTAFPTTLTGMGNPILNFIPTDLNTSPKPLPTISGCRPWTARSRCGNA